MEESVSLAAIGLAATCVGGVIWIMKYFANQLSRDLQAHTIAALKQQQSNIELAKAAREQKQASNEVLTFMKNLNGKLSKATIDTANDVKEQQ